MKKLISKMLSMSMLMSGLFMQNSMMAMESTTKHIFDIKTLLPPKMAVISEGKQAPSLKIDDSFEKPKGKFQALFVFENPHILNNKPINSIDADVLLYILKENGQTLSSFFLGTSCCPLCNTTHGQHPMHLILEYDENKLSVDQKYILTEVQNAINVCGLNFICFVIPYFYRDMLMQNFNDINLSSPQMQKAASQMISYYDEATKQQNDSKGV